MKFKKLFIILSLIFFTGCNKYALKKNHKLYKWTISRTPMSRWGNPEEISKLIYFLSIDVSSYINGEVINIDGGWSNT